LPKFPGEFTPAIHLSNATADRPRLPIIDSFSVIELVDEIEALAGRALDEVRMRRKRGSRRDAAMSPAYIGDQVWRRYRAFAGCLRG